MREIYDYFLFAFMGFLIAMRISDGVGSNTVEMAMADYGSIEYDICGEPYLTDTTILAGWLFVEFEIGE